MDVGSVGVAEVEDRFAFDHVACLQHQACERVSVLHLFLLEETEDRVVVLGDTPDSFDAV